MNVGLSKWHNGNEDSQHSQSNPSHMMIFILVLVNWTASDGVVKRGTYLSLALGMAEKKT